MGEKRFITPEKYEQLKRYTVKPKDVKNGTLDKNVLRQEPFRSVGSIVELFKDNMDDARKIIGIIDEINRNAEEITGA